VESMSPDTSRMLVTSKLRSTCHGE